MRITDIMKKLSHPSSQTFSPKVNNHIETQETKETAPLETTPMAEAEKIQQAPEDVITTPLSEVTDSSSSDATADVYETKETTPLETVFGEEAKKIQQAPEDVITTPLSEVTASSSSDATADVNETKEAAPLETVPVEEAEKIHFMRRYSAPARSWLETVTVEEAEKIQQAPEDVITMPLSEVTDSSSSDATADVYETKETTPPETVPVEVSVHPPPLTSPTRGGEKTFPPPVPLQRGIKPPPVPLTEGEKGGGRRPGGGDELLHKKFPGQVRGYGIDNDAGFLQMWKAVNEFLLNASENRKADPSA
ncbi:MAG: hypothetical protein NUV74_06810, partial [Candidatus Brocadiaceae bacterium]|nr:hypothetical protein [Candidatus Brocadiaceae bacterium]